MKNPNDISTLTQIEKLKRLPITFLYAISTRLQSPASKYEGQYGYPFNASGLGYGHGFQSGCQTEVITQVTIHPQAENIGFYFANATLRVSESYQAHFDDYSIRPKYSREFTIKVKTLHVDKTLPRIFVD